MALIRTSTGVVERRGDTGEVRPPSEDATAGREEGQAAGGATTEEPAGGTVAGAAPTDTKKILKYERSVFFIPLIHFAIIVYEIYYEIFHVFLILSLFCFFFYYCTVAVALKLGFQFVYFMSPCIAFSSPFSLMLFCTSQKSIPTGDTVLTADQTKPNSSGPDTEFKKK